LSDTTSGGYNKTPEAYRNPYMTATSSNNTNVSASIRATPSADSSLFVSAMWHSLKLRDLVWAGTQNRWETYRIAFGGEKGLGTGRLSLSGWFGGGTMNTTNVSQTPSFSILNPQAGVPYVSQTENATYSNIGGSLVYQASLGALHDIKLGVDGRSITANDPLNLFNTAGATGNILAHARHAFEGVFAQATLAPATLPIEVTLGLRGDFWQATNGSLSGNYLGSAFANGIAGQSYARFDPRIGAKLRLGGGFALRGAAYSNFAAPGMNQMYRAFIGGSSYTTSNPTLRPQTNTGGEVGFDYTARGALSGLTLSASVYANKLKNFIDYATVQSGCAAANNYCGTGISGINNGTLSQYVNAGDAVLRGFEVLGGWSRGRLSLSGGFTYTDAHLTSSRYTTASAGVIPDPVGQQLGQVPEWTATASANWRATDRLQLSASVKSFPSYWNTTSHTQRNDGATIVDLGASWRVWRSLEVYTSLQNVGNVHYLDQGYGYTTTNGSTVKGSTVPALGMPFWATFGLRAHI
ncbi:MAG TPA: TonB-dependent receptor, partial [Novosphingobium sp.]|nr:TonB-dependent receptor [Novosphingobium sp.]